jgi:hypothetical protein
MISLQMMDTTAGAQANVSADWQADADGDHYHLARGTADRLAVLNRGRG